ncbi:TetR/AcrR family transcriptional regulator [Streptomyces sp. NBC_01497]|uniref:TetR/AcrR family transcriptional regulator n=1 Tax=Streptomyces sp. NBC_01497 TaxID=2903885 RepID=UPI002E323AA3|nr:TetR/AcrR family transcriptional regulator [Streptomyces sp. NBC_01497]
MARTKEFDPDSVLRRAMDLFWERGYEQTSLQDLVERMSVGRRSLYDTFGDKHKLFVRALTQYVAEQEAMAAESAELAPDGRQAVQRLLETSITTGMVLRRGCLAVNTATEVAPGDPEAFTIVDSHFGRTRRLLLDQIIRGGTDGSISGAGDPEVLTAALFNVWLGLRVRVRAGTGLDPLMADLRATLNLLD